MMVSHVTSRMYVWMWMWVRVFVCCVLQVFECGCGRGAGACITVYITCIKARAVQSLLSSTALRKGLTGQEAHCFGLAGWLASSQDLLSWLSSVRGTATQSHAIFAWIGT